MIHLARQCIRYGRGLLLTLIGRELLHLGRQCNRYKELLVTFIGRELRARFRGTLFGPLWMLIQPLLFLVVYFTVFVEVLQMGGFNMRGVEPDHPMFEVYKANDKAAFALSMFAGLVPWIAFSETVARATGSIMENGPLIKKFAFPSELLPVYLVGVSLINTVISMTIIAIAVFVIMGSTPEMLWMFPLVLILQAMLTLGIAYLVAASAVFIRDLMQMIPILLTFLFFLSPIFYVTRQFESHYSWLLEWNPIAYLIEPYRQIFVLYPGLSPFTEVGVPPWRMVAILAAVSFGTLILGYSLFMRLKPRFADEV